MDKKKQIDIESLKPLLHQKHEWFKISDGWGENCKYCNSVVGIGTGTELISECTLRFNEEKFKEWIEFHNYSKAAPSIGNPRSGVRYYKRFSSITKTERDLLILYAQSHNIKGFVNKIPLVKELRNITK